MISCKICEQNAMTDLTQKLGDIRNYYCHNCKAHYYGGQWYTKKEWEEYIKEV